MTRRAFLFFVGGVAAAQILKPRIGYIVDRKGRLHGVEGVVGAFTLTEELDRDVLSADYSGRVLVVKKAETIRLGERVLEAPSGPATVVFDEHGNPEKIFFEQAGVLWTANADSFLSSPAIAITRDVSVREGELLVKGIPIRIASRPIRVSQLGQEWLAVYAEGANYAVRGEQVFELPEAGEDE